MTGPGQHANIVRIEWLETTLRDGIVVGRRDSSLPSAWWNNRDAALNELAARARLADAWRKPFSTTMRAWHEADRLARRVAELEAALREAHHVGRQLLGMVDQQTWRDQGGDDGQGHYEGDYYAEKVSESIESWGKLAGDGGGANKCCGEGEACSRSDCTGTPRSWMTTFQWLIERGQPEGLDRPEWLENSIHHPARDTHWTTDALQAAMFPDRERAEAYIDDFETGGRAVEHGFTPAAAAVDAALAGDGGGAA